MVDEWGDEVEGEVLETGVIDPVDPPVIVVPVVVFAVKLATLPERPVKLDPLPTK